MSLRSIMAALVWGSWVAACFSEPPRVECPAGEGGCICENGGACQSGLTCSLGYCIEMDCTPGKLYCSCVDGSCLSELQCLDGAVCVVPDGGSETAGGSSEVGSGGSVATGSEPTTDDASTSTDPTSPATADTSKPSTVCRLDSRLMVVECVPEGDGETPPMCPDAMEGESCLMSSEIPATGCCKDESTVARCLVATVSLTECP